MQVKWILLIYILWESQRNRLWQWLCHTYHRAFFLHFLFFPIPVKLSKNLLIFFPWLKVSVRGKTKQIQYRFELPFPAEGERNSFPTYCSKINLMLLGWGVWINHLMPIEMEQIKMKHIQTKQMKEQVWTLSFSCRGKDNGLHVISLWFSSLSEFVSFCPALCSLKSF